MNENDDSEIIKSHVLGTSITKVTEIVSSLYQYFPGVFILFTLHKEYYLYT